MVSLVNYEFKEILNHRTPIKQSKLGGNTNPTH